MVAGTIQKRSSGLNRWLCSLGIVLLMRAREGAAFAQSVATALLDPQAARSASLWRDEWPQFRLSEGLLRAAAALGAGAILLAGPLDEPRWQGGILFDDAVRNELRGRSAHTGLHAGGYECAAHRHHAHRRG